MLPKTAVVKGFVYQMELVNVTPVFTWRIAQVSFRYVILFYKLFWPTLRAIVIKKNFCEFEAEGRESIHKTNSFSYMGLNSKMHVVKNYQNLDKIRHFVSFHQNFPKRIVKRSDKMSSFLIWSWLLRAKLFC